MQNQKQLRARWDFWNEWADAQGLVHSAGGTACMRVAASAHDCAPGTTIGGHGGPPHDAKPRAPNDDDKSAGSGADIFIQAPVMGCSNAITDACSARRCRP